MRGPSSGLDAGSEGGSSRARRTARLLQRALLSRVDEDEGSDVEGRSSGGSGDGQEFDEVAGGMSEDDEDEDEEEDGVGVGAGQLASSRGAAIEQFRLAARRQAGAVSGSGHPAGVGPQTSRHGPVGLSADSSVGAAHVSGHASASGTDAQNDEGEQQLTWGRSQLRRRGRGGRRSRVGRSRSNTFSIGSASRIGLSLTQYVPGAA